MTDKIPTTEEGLVPVNGSKIRRIRKSRGMSQQQMANSAGMSRSYFADIERGDKRPRPVYAAAIAGALRVDIADILTASGK